MYLAVVPLPHSWYLADGKLFYFIVTRRDCMQLSFVGIFLRSLQSAVVRYCLVSAMALCREFCFGQASWRREASYFSRHVVGYQCVRINVLSSTIWWCTNAVDISWGTCKIPKDTRCWMFYTSELAGVKLFVFEDLKSCLHSGVRSFWYISICRPYTYCFQSVHSDCPFVHLSHVQRYVFKSVSSIFGINWQIGDLLAFLVFGINHRCRYY